MSALARWLRFNAVGVLGFAVQLGALALLGRCSRVSYLAASSLAVELAVLHNFLWHQRYTFTDRARRGGAGGRLLRFHLSNGLVSLAGNLLLMRLLVQGAHLAVIAANCIAVGCCSLANFFLGDRWVFAPAAPKQGGRSGRCMNAARRAGS